MVDETNIDVQNNPTTATLADNLQAVTETSTDQSIQSESQSSLSQETQGQAVQEPKRSKSPQESFAELKRKAQRLEKERDEAVKFAQDVYKQQQPSQQPVEQDDPELNPDDLVEGKHLNRYLKKSTQEIRALKEQLQLQQRMANEQAIEARLKAQFPDFDKVVTKDNIELLREAEPELARTVHETQDLYAKAVSAYKMIKTYGVYTPDVYQEDRQKAQQNAYKPRPTATISPQQGDTPLSHANAFANGLTEDLRKQLYKEMIESRKKM